MARRRSLLSSRTSRLDLPTSDAPTWEIIGPGVRLGYRRGRGTTGRGGSWLSAARSPDGARVQTRLGRADDIAAVDGVLTHEQAKEAAKAWAKSLKTGGPASRQLTVDDVLNKYLAMREGEGARSDVRSSFNAHISPQLGKLRVADLTTERLRNWRDALSKQPKRFRTGNSSKENRIVVIDPSDEEGMRRRRDSTNRILTVLKAALNWAYRERLVTDDTAWRLLKPFKGTTAARVRFLDTAEQNALLKAAAGSLRRLVAAALMTGARFGELDRLRISDFDPANGSIFIAKSKAANRGMSRSMTAGLLSSLRWQPAGRRALFFSRGTTARAGSRESTVTTTRQPSPQLGSSTSPFTSCDTPTQARWCGPVRV
jgi:integrase